MRLRKRTILLNAISMITLALFILSAMLIPVAHADQGIAPKNSVAYDYPIKPGTEEWEALRSHTEMLEACQIPESILRNMSTSALIETVLNYPLLIDMWAYDDTQAGFQIMADHFNGIKELLRREDAATELVFKYKSLDLSSVSDDWTPLQRGSFVLGRISAIEMLLANDTIMNKMTDIERLDLLTQVRTNYVVKQQKNRFYGGPSLRVSSLIVEGVAERFSSVQGQDPVDYCTRYPVSYIKTPKGSTVQCAYKWGNGCNDWSSPTDVNEHWKSLYPAAYLLGTSTWKYQCHSYAWYQQSTSNTHTILCTPSTYWTDRSYTFRGIWPNGWQAGNKVYYDSAYGDTYDHSGVAVWTWDGAPLKGVKSKWGPGPLMEHLHNYCPYWYYSPTVKIYSR